MTTFNTGNSKLVAMALLLRGEMQFLWQHREEALQDLQRVADMSDISTEVTVTIATTPTFTVEYCR